MKTKVFSNKKLSINKLSKRDLKNAKEFQKFINSLIREEAKITLDKKLSLEEERKWLKSKLEEIRNRKTVLLVVKDRDRIVGTTEIHLGRGRQNHVGNFGITIRKGYRGIGLGTYLMKEIIKLAKKELRPKPKVLRLSVFPNNKIALGLYKKFGFKKVAVVPKQLKYKDKLRDEVIMILEV